MTRCILAALLALASGGCVPTLNSIFTSKDVAGDPAIEGVWQNADATWTINPFDAKGGRYRLHTEMKDQPPAEWHLTLGVIGTNRFVELLPQRPSGIHTKSFFGSHFIQLRSFWKVSLEGNNLTLTSMSSQWMDTMLKQNKLTIAHERPEGGLLFLTASTPELQEFIAAYANDPGAFPTKGDEKGIAFVRSEEDVRPQFRIGSP